MTMIDRNYRPSERMIELGGALVLAMAWCDLISEKVVAYQKRILDAQVFYEGDWAGLGREDEVALPRIRITDPAKAWLMPRKDMDAYVALCEVERAKDGLRVAREGNCPKLEAEEAVREAERNLIAQMGEEVAEPLGRLNEGPCELRKQGIEVMLSLLAPFLDRDAIMQRARAA